MTLDYAKAERNLAHFFKAAWPILEPDVPLLSNWHHDLLAEYLTATLTGDIKRLIINMPPRYGKSLFTTVQFPVWSWIKNPNLKYIFASYAQNLSTKHSLDRRNIIQSFWFQSAWGKSFKLQDDENQKMEFANDKRGSMIATSMQGSVTGKGADFVIVDDPHNPMQAESDTQRESVIQAFDSMFTTRLNSQKTGRIIVIMQRLHDKDLSGHLLGQKKWTHVCLPAESPKYHRLVMPISKRQVVRGFGQLLHPEREGKDELAAQKKALGSYSYSGQYDQNPTPRVGGILKRTYWKYWQTLPERFDEMIQSWDLTFKDLETSDYVVGTVWGRVGANKYLLDMVREQMGLTASCKAILAQSQKWPKARKILIEDKANGPAVIEVLKSKISGIIPVNPVGSKMERAAAIEPQCEAGNVFFPDPLKFPWVQDVIEECAKFPRGEHDDIVDSVTQALIRLDERSRKNMKSLSIL